MQSTDVLSRVIWGLATAIEVVVLAVVFSLAIGVPLGLISGYVGGKLDRVLVLINDALFAFPYLLLAIVIAFLLSYTGRTGGAHRRGRDHRRLRTAVLPRRQQPRDQRSRGVLRGGGARPRARPGARSSAAMCSRT